MSVSHGMMPPAVDRLPLQERVLLDGVAKISLSGEFRWTNRFIVMTTGNGLAHGNDTASGYYDIYMPADGFAVPVAGGTTRAVVPASTTDPINTGGILLNVWEALWYRTVKGANNTFIPGNLLIQPYTQPTALTPPDRDGWLLLAVRSDQTVWRIANGDDMGLCMQIGGGGNKTAANWAMMRQRAMGDGYFYCPGGNTATPTAFGFTGTIRWIDGGGGYANNQGYLDSTPATRTAGTPVLGVNGAAARTWRVMTAAEKPAWFGGALRSVNPIVPATSTVVDLADNETLFYVPNIDSTGLAPASAKFVVAGYAGQVNIPAHWMPIASRQTTGGQTTIQVLVGGLQYALKSGDATYTTTPADHYKDAQRRRVTHKGLKYCRWTQAAFFAGAAANGLLTNGPQGLLISWDANTLMYGISDGYVSWGNQFTYINVPAAGTQIPVTNINSNVTRTVQTVSGRTYIPLGNWEALYFIPPAYAGGAGSADGDFVIGYYINNHCIPANAVMVAKAEGAVAWPAGSTQNKTRVLFADGTYMQPGSSLPTAAPVQNDHAQGSGDWRPLVYPGQTGPGMTAAMPATPGVVGAYNAPYTAFYNYRTSNDDPRGFIHLEGIVLLNADIANGGRIAFLPGVQVRGNPILAVPYMATTHGDSYMIMGQVRFGNITINGSTGVEILATGGSFTAANPARTLGANGAAAAAGVAQWVSFSSVILNHG